MKPRFAPFWSARFPRHRRPAFPRLRGDLETQVAIVGGGLTGSACAYALAASRVPVVLLERERLGSGATGGAAGLIREDFDEPFAAIASLYGLRAARALFRGMRRASMDFSAVLRRLEADCGLAPQDLLHLAPPTREGIRVLRREYEARRAAGLDHRWVTASAVLREAAVGAGGAIRTRGAVLDPYRACLRLAAEAVARGGVVFERSEVRRIQAKAKTIEITTAGGVVRAETVAVAGGASIQDLRPLRRHLRARHGYGVVTEPLPAAVRRVVGTRAATLRDWEVPPHVVRPLTGDRLLIAGADQDAVPARATDQTLVQRTGQLMYELSLLYPPISGTSPEWAWSYAFDETLDGLPYVGPHRNFPRHLFALGLGSHGAGASWLAARIVMRHVTGSPAKEDHLFGFSRVLHGP